MKWFTFKHPYKWWQWVLHPISGWRIKKYLDEVETKVREQIGENEILEQMARKAAYGWIVHDPHSVYGRSPEPLDPIGEKL